MVIIGGAKEIEALDKKGLILWEYTAQTPDAENRPFVYPSTSPLSACTAPFLCYAVSDTLTVGCAYTGAIVALDLKTGEIRWRFELGDGAEPLAINRMFAEADGSVTVVASGQITRVDALGRKLWQQAFSEEAMSEAASVSQAEVWPLLNGGMLACVPPTNTEGLQLTQWSSEGEVNWRYSLSGCEFVKGWTNGSNQAAVVTVKKTDDRTRWQIHALSW